MTTAAEQHQPTWLFGRDELTIRLRRLPDMRLSVLSSEGRERGFTFADIDELTTFQCDFEQHLVDTGWSLIDFGPERRRGTDRRSVPRVGPDRRRYPLFKPDR